VSPRFVILLLLEDDAASKAQEISRALVGLGMANVGLEEDYEDQILHQQPLILFRRVGVFAVPP
jgi:hypothetical protein